ncbi:hypothetical protein L6452_38550 [Arctium lappa]|uniref:Uncharacterized protein n=1 Tax=Arctium lappa TaxID=4217 RepID=A0ACB8XQA6_ARCLA|nr:hypothetical protein L6452_38550 [Arctium lappa]
MKLLVKDKEKPNLDQTEKKTGKERNFPLTEEKPVTEADEGEEGSHGVEDTIMATSSNGQNGCSKESSDGKTSYETKERTGSGNGNKGGSDMGLEVGLDKRLNIGSNNEKGNHGGTCCKRSIKEIREAHFETNVGETQVENSATGVHGGDSKTGSDIMVKSDRVTSQSQEGEKSLIRWRGDCIFERGRVSFHYIKQKASKKNSQSSRNTVMSNRPKLSGGGREKSNSISLSNELRNGDATEGLEEFGKEVGMNWDTDSGAASKKGVSRTDG